MTLQCYYDHDAEPGDVVWNYPRAILAYGKRRTTKCCSCGERIRTNDQCAEFSRYKLPDSDIEIRIYGEHGEVPRASYFHCFECAWRSLALIRHGYAINITDDMRRLMIEHDDLADAGLAGCL